MKKLIALLTALMLAAAALPMLAAPAKDVTTLAEWDFETAEEIAEWTILDGDGDGMSWNWSEDGYDNLYSNTGEYFMYSESYDWENHEPLTPDNWLISPAVTLPEGAESITLSFWQMGYESYSDMCEVYVSTDGGSTWSTCLHTFQTLPAWVDEEVNLTMYAGETINIAFRHYQSNDGYDVGLDTVSLTAVGGSAPTLMGDVNFDGSVDTIDVLLIMRHAMSLIELDETACAAADMDGDGAITINDSLVAMRLSIAG